MLASRRECACTVIDVSSAGLALLAKDSGAAGESVVLYVDGIGRIQGEIVRQFEGGFAVRVVGTSRAADALAQRFA